MKNENNIIEISGVISEFPVYSHEIAGEAFFRMVLNAKRNSGNYDYIPVMVSEKLLFASSLNELAGKKCLVVGQIRSYKTRNKNKKKTDHHVFADRISVDPSIETHTVIGDINKANIIGYICNRPNFRVTPSGREISDIFIAVNRPRNKSDYIPCVAWGRDAVYISNFGAGSKVSINGRIQSREYVKKLEDGTEETRTAYELSVSRIDVLESWGERR